MPKVVVQITRNFKDIDVDISKLKELAKAVCIRFAQSGIRNTQYEISIAIVDDAQIRRANKQFLNRRASTDCLSFDLSDDTARKSFELVVNAGKAVKEAALRGHSAEAELALYVTHGLLHNFGFDDSTKSQAKKMHDTEDEILQQQSYGFVYNS
ncbi:MAG: rRNA maturation RNase YbeY [Planctomycetota bacterium]|jgi:probable rRNA maturation factor